jgi:hypothetical protein
LARLDSTVDFVVGVTRLKNFKGSEDDISAYIRAHENGACTDPILAFHTDYGAEIMRTVPHFRPEDKANYGTGVLIRYDTKRLSAMRKHNAALAVTQLDAQST